MRALSRDTQTVLNCLQRDGEVVVTNNGKPAFLMIDLTDRDLVETVNHFRHAGADRYSPQKQHEALKQFFASVDARNDEPLTDDDFSVLENSRVNFKRKIDL